MLLVAVLFRILKKMVVVLSCRWHLQEYSFVSTDIFHHYCVCQLRKSCNDALPESTLRVSCWCSISILPSEASRLSYIANLIKDKHVKVHLLLEHCLKILDSLDINFKCNIIFLLLYYKIYQLFQTLSNYLFVYSIFYFHNL